MSSRESVAIRRVSHAILRGTGPLNAPYFFEQRGSSKVLDLIASTPFDDERALGHLHDRFAVLGLRPSLASVPVALHREVTRTQTGPVDLTRLYFRADIPVDQIPPEIATKMSDLTAFQVACLSSERLRREMVRWLVMADAGLKLPESASIVKSLEPIDNLQQGDSGEGRRRRGTRVLVLQTCHDQSLRLYTLQHPLVINGTVIPYKPELPTVNGKLKH